MRHFKSVRSHKAFVETCMEPFHNKTGLLIKKSADSIRMRDPNTNNGFWEPILLLLGFLSLFEKQLFKENNPAKS